MEIILLENIEKLGFKDEVISVKPGFARNFLIPKGKAKLATESSLKVLKEKLRQQQQKENQVVEAANKIAEILPKLEVKIKAKVSEGSNKLFGSITTAQFVSALKVLGHEIDKKFVKLNTIKELGKYEAEVRLHRTVSTTIPFEVISE